MRTPRATARGRDPPGAVDGHAVVGRGQVLGHDQPLDAAARDPVEDRARHAARRRRLHHHALDLADQLHRAEREAVAAVEVPVVDRQRLLERDVVAAVEVDGDDVRVVVHHEVAPDLVRELASPRGCRSSAEASSSAAEFTAPAASTNSPPVTSTGPSRPSATRRSTRRPPPSVDDPAHAHAGRQAGVAGRERGVDARTSPRRSWRRAGTGSRRRSRSGCTRRRAAGRCPSRSRSGARPGARSRVGEVGDVRLVLQRRDTGTACCATARSGPRRCVPWTR